MAYKAKKKKNIGVKIFIWFMFIAMLASFAIPMLYYILATK